MSFSNTSSKILQPRIFQRARQTKNHRDSTWIRQTKKPLFNKNCRHVEFNQRQQRSGVEKIFKWGTSSIREGWGSKSRQRNRRIKLLIASRAKLRFVDRYFIYLFVRKTNMMAFNLWTSIRPIRKCEAFARTRDILFELFMPWRRDGVPTNGDIVSVKNITFDSFIAISWDLLIKDKLLRSEDVVNLLRVGD